MGFSSQKSLASYLMACMLTDAESLVMSGRLFKSFNRQLIITVFLKTDYKVGCWWFPLSIFGCFLDSSNSFLLCNFKISYKSFTGKPYIRSLISKSEIEYLIFCSKLQKFFLVYYNYVQWNKCRQKVQQYGSFKIWDLLNTQDDFEKVLLNYLIEGEKNYCCKIIYSK